MASQAVKHKLYHAAVVFFKELKIYLKQKEDGKRSEHFKYLWNTTITYDDIKLQLSLAMKSHDDALHNSGQYGVIHRCNNMPFKKKTHHLSNQSIVSILDRKTLYRYDQILRKTTTENKEHLTREVTTATTVQSDKLCNGEQIRVNIFLRACIKIFFFSMFSITGPINFDCSQSLKDPNFVASTMHHLTGFGLGHLKRK